MQPHYLSEFDLHLYLGLPLPSITRMVKEKRISFILVGRRRYYNPDRVCSVLEGAWPAMTNQCRNRQDGGKPCPTITKSSSSDA